MKRVLMILAMLLLPGAALAECPAESTEIYSGEAIGTFCYNDSTRLFWANIVRICLVDDGPTLTYEAAGEEGQERLVGVCRGALETRP